MKSMKSRHVIAVVALLVMGGISVSARSQPRVEMRDFMRAKLKFSQKVLEGLVTDDLTTVQKAAQEMKLLTLEETWQVLQSPEYVEFSRKFRAEADALVAAAGRNKLESSTAAFNRLTTQCVECHKYVRDVRMAKACN